MKKKSRKRRKILSWLPAVLLAVIVIFFLSLPSIPLYKDFVHALWTSGHYKAVYYLNYRDSKLATEEADYYFGQGPYDLPRATTAYQLALKLDPKVLWGHYQLARIYFVQGNYAKATEEINTELRLHPENLRSLYVRGLIELSQNNLPAAEQDFARFVVWSPAEWAGYNDLAFVQAKEGKYSESEATITQAMKKARDAQDIPWLWNSLGLAQLNRLHYTEAQKSFARALELAQKMTPQIWHQAYSGNDPASIGDSIKNFQDAVAQNLLVAQQGSSI